MASSYHPSGQRRTLGVPGRARVGAVAPHSPSVHSGRGSRNHSRVHPSAEVLPLDQDYRGDRDAGPPPPYAAPIDPLIASTPPVFLRPAGTTPQHPRWQKKASWVRLGDADQPPPAVGSLVAAGAVLLFSGSLSCLLCFYGLSQGGRRYYLDFGLLSGFSSVLIGSLGLRARTWHRSPNRNYITGYIILSFFSVLTTAGLVILNFGRLQSSSRSGYGSSSSANSLVDLIGGAECGIAVISVVIAAAGFILVSTSRGNSACCLNCCGDPPPDDRVAHRAEGFTL
ncbi:uncharacterized protein LOC124169445 [Ischnura elegans]|uniref:uncharacterized protein LOC124169445 n=1 Tax=Ischnura elegans TaxID=197161 RepID=UPI001ED86AAF|nr:uncharacterized protein LOC124169445 [Ischnura elegans]